MKGAVAHLFFFALLVAIAICLSRDASAESTVVPALNPFEFNIATIKRGKQFYTIHCLRCHGADGKGDTEMREFLKTAPSDLSDGQWLYPGQDGGEDAAIFDVIKRGRSLRDMPAFSAEMSDEAIWQVVSYLRYLGGRRP